MSRKSATEPIPSPGLHDAGNGLSFFLIFSLSTLGFVASAIIRVSDALLPPISSEFNISVGEAGIIITVFAVIYGMFQLIHGGLGDRFGKIHVIVVFTFIGAIATYSCAYAANLTELAILRGATGAAVAAGIPLSLAYIADNVNYENRQSVIGGYIAGITIGQVFGVAISGMVTDLIGWRNVFRMFGVLLFFSGTLLTYMVLSKRAPKEADGGTKMQLATYINLVKSPAARAIFLICIVEGTFMYGSLMFAGALMRDRFGISYTEIGIMLGGFGIGGLVLSLSINLLLKWFTDIQFVVIGGVLVGGCYLLLAFLQTPKILFPMFLLIGFGFFMFHITLQTKGTEMAPKTRGVAMALFSLSVFSGQALGALIIGSIIDRFSYVHAYVFTALAIFLLTFRFARFVAASA
ncbi:MAG: MFS transporter, partial [Rhodospirillales bacterium]|nr:MFS transporter [Rhodospirillales bacterium]